MPATRRIKSIEGITAVVTGASSGIGLEFCRRLVADGAARLLMVSNEPEALSRCAAELSEGSSTKISTLDLDLTVPDVAERLCAALDSLNMTPDLFINNAGVFSFCPVTETSRRKTELFIDLHVRAVTLLSRAIARRMEQAGGGHILNMSSMSCWTPMPGIALYAATKAYIRTFSRALHYELRDKNVMVTVACPGGIATDLFGLPENLKKLAVNIKALDTPRAFAAKALRKTMKGKMQYINGGINRLTIVMAGIAPTWLRMMVKRKMLDKGIRR